MAIESIEPAEMSFGSHEHKLPDGALLSDKTGQNKRDIYFDKSGKDVVIYTWLPLTGEQTGMVLNHNEPMSISQLYSKPSGDSVYCPTVCFVYHPCEQTMTSLKNLTEENYDSLNPKLALHNIIDGYDELGAFIMTEEHGAYWIGSRLDIHQAREINSESSATTLQVAGGVIAGMSWIVQNTDKGLIEPEDIEDYDHLLNIAEKYWGELVFAQSDWLPGGDNPDPSLQFSSFLKNN
jgi:homospermidine synthase